jgi:hypothetical protein
MDTVLSAVPGGNLIGGVLRRMGRKAVKGFLDDVAKGDPPHVAVMRATGGSSEGEAAVAAALGRESGGGFVTVPGGTPLQNPSSIMMEAKQAAREFGMKGRPKVWNITVDGKPIQWFKSGAQASGKFRAMLNRAGKGWEKISANKYRTPEGNIVETNWMQVIGGV